MGSQDPTVSIIIATYNRYKTLKLAIDSVLWQTFTDFELLVVGDKCTDASEDLVTGYADPRVTWFNLKENSGYQSEPTNQGLRRSNGKYIAYLNHDDLWYPDHLSSLVNYIEESGADVVYSMLQWVTSHVGNYGEVPHFPGAPRSPEVSAVLHKKEIVKKIGYWKGIKETRSIPRVDFFRRAEFSGLKFAFCPNLSVVKFLWDEVNYTDHGPQSDYMKLIQEDPKLRIRELNKMLANSYSRLEFLPSWSLLKYQFANSIKRAIINEGIDPTSLLFWKQRSYQIRKWRKNHKLE